MKSRFLILCAMALLGYSCCLNRTPEIAVSLSTTEAEPGSVVTVTFSEKVSEEYEVLFGETAMNLVMTETDSGFFWVPLLDAGTYEVVIQKAGETEGPEPFQFTILELQTAGIETEPGVLTEGIVNEQVDSVTTIKESILPELIDAEMLDQSQSALAETQLTVATDILSATLAELSEVPEEERIIIDRALSEAGIDILSSQARSLLPGEGSRGITDVLSRDYDHLHLVGMDAYSAVLNQAEATTSEIGSWAGKAGNFGSVAKGSITALSLGFKIIIKFIEFYIPTDLQEITIANSTESDDCVVPIEGESDFVFMGRFDPESNPLEAVMKTVFDTVSDKLGTDTSKAAYAVLRRIIGTADLSLEDQIIGMDLQETWGEAVGRTIEIDHEVYSGGTEAIVEVLNTKLGTAATMENAPDVLRDLPTATPQIENEAVASIDFDSMHVTAVGEGETSVTGNAYRFTGGEVTQLSKSTADFGSIYVTSIVPRSGATGVSPNTEIKIYFDATVASEIGNIELDDTTYTESNAEITIEGSNCVVLKPDEAFESEATITGISVSGFEDLEGNPLLKDEPNYTFTVSAEYIEFVWSTDLTPGTVRLTGGKDGVSDGPAGEVTPADDNSEGLTHIVAFHEDNSDNYFEFSFYGDQPGTYHNANCAMVYVTAPGVYYSSYSFSHVEDVTITCDEIGDVGGVITGTFSATLYYSKDESIAMDIRDGKFSVPRVENLNW